jgi:hypothetical protein
MVLNKLTHRYNQMGTRLLPFQNSYLIKGIISKENSVGKHKRDQDHLFLLRIYP